MKTPYLAPLLIAVLGAPLLAGSDDLKAEVPMTRPSGAPDGDAKGKIKVEHKTDKNRHKLSVEAEYIDTSLTFEAWVADGGGTLQMIAIMPFNGPGEVEVEFDTDEGLPLPFNASSVEQLAGRTVEVRAGGLTYLTGTVPSLDGSGGSGSGSGGGSWLTFKQFLVRPATSPDPNVTGYVEVRYRQSDNDQKFKVEAEHVDPSASFSVFLETGIGSGILQNVGAMKQEDSDEVELEIETEHGTPLPFGVAHVNELAGRAVEVRDATNAVYLAGIVPDIGGSTQNASATSNLIGAGKATVVVQKKTKKGDHRFDLKIQNVSGNLPLEVWMFNPATTSFAKVTDVVTKKNGSVTYKVRTKKGQSLPLGASTIDEIGGLSIEVRESGAVRFTGTVPTL